MQLFKTRHTFSARLNSVNEDGREGKLSPLYFRWKCRSNLIKQKQAGLFHSSQIDQKPTLRLLWGPRHQRAPTLVSWVQQTQTSGTNASLSLCVRSQGRLGTSYNVTVSCSGICSLCLAGLIIYVNFLMLSNIMAHASIQSTVPLIHCFICRNQVFVTKDKISLKKELYRAIECNQIFFDQIF